MPHLEVDGGRLHYEQHGEPAALAIVLAHGFGMAGAVWEHTVAALLAQGRYVITYDQRCCGESDKAFSDVTIDAQGNDIVALCDHLNLESVILNGWSLGGALVVDAAAKLGSRVAGLVLTGGATPRYTQADGFPHGGVAADVEATVAALQADRPGFLRTLYYDGVFAMDVGETVKKWCFDMAMQESPEGDAALGELADVDQRQLLSEITCPALVLHGDQDGVVPIGIGEVAAQDLANAEFVVMKGCGHAPFLEDQTTYHSRLLGFVEKLS